MSIKHFKLAIAQISTDPGNIEANTQKIINKIIEAKENDAKMVIFPELTIPGYMSLDLMLLPKYIEQNLEALDKITKHTDNICAIVGFINQDKRIIGPDGTPRRYNSAAIISNGKILGIQDKTLLPDYDIFFENRYFSEGHERKIIEFEGIKWGIQICEDLWDENYPIKVSEELVRKGAEVLINISGSPFYIGKRFDREKIIKRVHEKQKVPFIYVNTVGVQDGYDGELVFDGQSMIFNVKGELVHLGAEFEEELSYITTDQLLTESKPAKQLDLSGFNPQEELLEGLTFAIKEYFRKSNFSKAFIGLSGGIDSAVVAVLASGALGSKNVTGIYLPSPFSSKESFEDSKQLAENLGINFKIIPIEGLFKEFLTTLKKEFDHLPFDTAEENIQARIRGIILMAHANKFGGLVISTANKTETALGYATLYGDMCGAITPLSDVSKLRVYELAQLMNSKGKILIPENSIKKIPTAELRENQTDEGSLGASYEIISPLVDEIIEDMQTQNELVKKYPKEIVEKITRLINLNEYKRRQSAPGVKVTKKSFGIGRRIPIAHNFKN